MTNKELIQIITRWANKAEADKLYAQNEEKYRAQNYFMGKEHALKNVLELIKLADAINTPF